MKKILGLVLALGLAAALGAQPTYDGGTWWANSTTGTFNNTGSSQTYVVVGIYTTGAQVGSILSVSYGGQGLTQQVVVSGVTGSMYQFTLAAPPTGSNTVSVTFNVAPTNYYVAVAAYDGVTGIGNTASAYPAANTSMTYGSMGGGSTGLYFGGAFGSAPVLTASTLTSRQADSSGATVFILGDTTSTGSQTFTATDSVGYQLTGTMIELQGAATPTPTFTATISPTPTSTWTASPTNTPVNTATPTLTISPTFTVSDTPTDTPTLTPSPIPTSSFTASPTFSDTPTLTDTPTFTPTLTDTSTDTPTISPTWTFSASPTPTDTPTVTKTSTISPTPTDTPTSTFTPTDTPTDTPTFTVTLTFTPTSTISPTASPTLTPSPSFTASPTPGPLPMNSYGQFQNEYAPYTTSWVVSSLTTNTSWTNSATGCVKQPCVITLGNPALTPGENEYYTEALPGPLATQTPATNGIPIAPGAVIKIYGAPGESIWAKAAVTAQPASEMEVKQ